MSEEPQSPLIKSGRVVGIFGQELSDDVIASFTSGFAHLPLACEILLPSGRRVLCTHGGIPRFNGPPLDNNKLALLKDPYHDQRDLRRP